MNIPPHSIAVIGAGPMGLAVAYQLIKDGYQPVIYEADNRIGGMSASFDFDGLKIERYYHFHCTSDEAFFEILNELGIAQKLHWVKTRMGYFYRGKVCAWGNPWALLTFPGLSLMAKMRYGLHAFICSKRTNGMALDKLEATGWLKRWVGREAYEVLWRKLFEYKFYEYAETLSAAWIWSRIRRLGRSRYNLFEEKLGYLEGGSDTLLHAMRNHIEKNGGTFHLSTPVSQVVIADGRVKGIRTRKGFHAHEAVISTVPLPYCGRMLPDLPAEILEKYSQVNNIAVVCVIAKLRRPVTGNFWLNVNDPGMDIPGMVEYSNLRPMDVTIVYVPFYMPGTHTKFQDDDSVFRDKVRRYIHTINPLLQEEDFLAIHVNRYRYAQPICQPGFLDSLPPVKLPVKGLWAADTSYYYPEDRGISESIRFGVAMAKQAILV